MKFPSDQKYSGGPCPKTAQDVLCLWHLNLPPMSQHNKYQSWEVYNQILIFLVPIENKVLCDAVCYVVEIYAWHPFLNMIVLKKKKTLMSFIMPMKSSMDSDSFIA